MKDKDDIFFPLEDFFRLLESKGFKISPDIYIRIHKLLNTYANKNEFHGIKTLKYHLGSIICTSEDQLSLFHSQYDIYYGEYENIKFFTKEESSLGGKQWLIFLGLLLLGLMGLIAFYVNYSKCPEIPIPKIIYKEDLNNSELIFFSTNVPKLPKSFWEPDLDSIIWQYEGNNLHNGREFKHRFLTPGKKHLTLSVYFSNNCILSIVDSLLIREHQEDFSGFASVLSRLDEIDRSRKNRQDQNERERTVENNSEVSVKKTPSENDTNSLDIFSNPGKIPDTVPIPKLKPIKKDFIDEDISDLLKKDKYLWLREFLLYGLILYLVYLFFEAFLASNRKLIIGESEGGTSPFRHRLRPSVTAPKAFQELEFNELTLKLQKRTISIEKKRIDTIASIKRTSLAAGFPILSFKDRSKASQYLFLIEKEHQEDHLAQLYVELAKELRFRDISVEIYFYNKNPTICWRRHRNESLKVEILIQHFADYRLLIIGKGDSLIGLDGASLASWTQVFDYWDKKAFLSTKATEEWTLTENIINTKFVLAPATLSGIGSLPMQWDSEKAITPYEWQKFAYEIAPPAEDSLQMLNELHAYLGTTLFQWLAACAWYPELSWELSLRLGRLIKGINESDDPLPIEFYDLLHIFRLPIFRLGEVPTGLREDLVHSLPEKIAKMVRQELLIFMETDKEPPPEGSYADNDRKERKRLFSYLNAKNDDIAAKILQEDFSAKEHEIRIPSSIDEYKRFRDDPLVLLVPANYLAGKIPFWGDGQITRILGLSSIFLSLFWLIWFFYPFHAQPLTYDPNRMYTQKELILSNAIDSSRWFTHLGYQYLNKDSVPDTDLANIYFQNAMNLSPKTGIISNNWGLSQYNRGIKFYNQGKWTQAREVFDSSFYYLSKITNKIENDSIQHIFLAENYPGRFWLRYGFLTSSLLEIENDSMLYTWVKSISSRLGDDRPSLFCSPETSQHPAYWRNIVDSLSRDEEQWVLLNTRLSQSVVIPSLESIFSCLSK